MSNSFFGSSDVLSVGWINERIPIKIFIFYFFKISQWLEIRQLIGLIEHEFKAAT